MISKSRVTKKIPKIIQIHYLKLNLKYRFFQQPSGKGQRDNNNIQYNYEQNRAVPNLKEYIYVIKPHNIIINYIKLNYHESHA